MTVSHTRCHLPVLWTRFLPTEQLLPYLLDLLLGYGCHGGRSSPDATTTLPAGLCRADSPPLHVILVPACDKSQRWAVGLSHSSRDFCPIHQFFVPGRDIQDCTVLLWFLVLTKHAKIFYSSAKHITNLMNI